MSEKASEVAGPLNPEPSDQKGRAAEGLPPKSYNTAVKEHLVEGGDPPPYEETAQTKQTSGTGAKNRKSKKSSNSSSNSNSNSNNDTTTTTTNSSLTQTQSHTTNTTSTYSNDSSLSRTSTRSETTSKTSGVKSHIANLYGDGILEKEYENDEGLTLTSTKPPKGYHTALEQDRKERDKGRGNAQDRGRLVSGRVAGQWWSRSKIRWAPLNVPVQRRLQTLMVLMHALSPAALLALFFSLCTVPLFWPILIPYLLYTLLSSASVSGELSHRSEFLRRSPMWSLFASYFPARLHRSEELAPTRKYIFGYHPHGIISLGAYAAFSTEALGFGQLFPGITNTLLTLDSNFRIPLYRDYALAMGLASVSRESIDNILTKGGPNGEGMGRAATIVIGGARESLDATPNKLKLVLKRRKGFVKLAIRNGADLVPVLGFGENDLYEQFQAEKHPWIHKAQLTVKRFLGFTIPLFHARGVFNYDVGLLPYRRPINIVVGRPIAVEQNAKPDDELVAEIHQRYMDELQRLWDSWKDTFAKDREGEMEIIE